MVTPILPSFYSSPIHSAKLLSAAIEERLVRIRRAINEWHIWVSKRAVNKIDVFPIIAGSRTGQLAIFA